MNLLLLLSALLSALTGVGSSVRAQERAQAVAEGAIAARQTAPTRRIVTQHPRGALPTLIQTADAGLVVALMLTPAEPAYATRRRE